MPPLLARLSRRPLLCAGVLALLIGLPSLGDWRFGDDWFRDDLLDGAVGDLATGPTELFHFGPATLESAGGVAYPAMPFWAEEGFRVRFFRPLASLTHAADRALWGEVATGDHVANGVWWVALALAATALLGALSRREAEPSAILTLLAASIFALDEVHGISIAWISGRNGLMGALGVVLALWAWIRWRERGGALWGVATMVATAFALASNEIGAIVIAWIVAYELILGDRARSWRQRLVPLLGPALLVAAQLALFAFGGYGTRHSGVYVDPFGAPVEFLSRAIVRGPTLLLGLLVPAPIDVAALFSYGAQWGFALAGVVVGLLAWVVLRPTLRASAPARFAAVASLVALLPTLGAPPNARLLLLSSVGFAYVLALHLTRTLLQGHAAPGGRPLAWALLAVNLGLSPLLAVGSQVLARGAAAEQADYATTMEHPRDAADSRVLLLAPGEPLTQLFLFAARRGLGLPTGASWVISSVLADSALERLDERSFRLTVAAPGFLWGVLDQVVRGRAMREGERFAAGAVSVIAREVDEGLPRVLDVTVDLPLDDPRVWLLAWSNEAQRYVRVPPPAVGACTLLAAADHPARRLFPHGRMTECPASLGSRAEPPRACRLQVDTGAGWVERGPVSCADDGATRLLVLGDPGLAGPTLRGTVAASGPLCRARGCDLLLLPGDLLYGDGADAERAWPAIWDGTLAGLALPTLAVLGNHEYRNDDNPDRKRAVLFAADGRAGLVLPAASYAARVVDGEGTVRLAIAALDTDSVTNAGPDMPGLGEAALRAACGTGAPVVWMGHHPPSSQGRHHNHEAASEAALRRVALDAVAGGCRLALLVAGHDHDLQVYGPSCEEAGLPPVLVSGVSARGFRDVGSDHLATCPADHAAVSVIHAGERPEGGLAYVVVQGDGAATVELALTRPDGALETLTTVGWGL